MAYPEKNVQYYLMMHDLLKSGECKSVINAAKKVIDRLNLSNNPDTLRKRYSDYKLRHNLDDSILGNSIDFYLKSQNIEKKDVKCIWYKQTESGNTTYSVFTKNDIDYFQQEKDEFLKLIEEKSPKREKLKYNSKKDPYLCEISLPDIHYGQISKATTEELEENWLNQIETLCSKSLVFNIGKFVLPIGNDGMNSEGLRGTTTKGTKQEEGVSWTTSFSGYCSLMIKGIDLLSQYAPVEVIVIYGNHDLERCYYAGEVLKAYYKNDKNIIVDNDYRHRKYFQYGNSMILFTHGNNEKPNSIAMNMPIEESKMFSDCKYWEVHCGHFHKEIVLDEFKRIKVRFIPSICTIDDWHKQKGFNTFRCGQAYIWSKDKGLIAMLQDNLL